MIKKKEKIMKAISNKITADEARIIAKEAYIFTYGLVMNYRTMYRQAITVTVDVPANERRK